MGKKRLNPCPRQLFHIIKTSFSLQILPTITFSSTLANTCITCHKCDTTKIGFANKANTTLQFFPIMCQRCTHIFLSISECRFTGESTNSWVLIWCQPTGFSKQKIYATYLVRTIFLSLFFGASALFLLQLFNGLLLFKQKLF